MRQQSPYDKPIDKKDYTNKTSKAQIETAQGSSAISKAATARGDPVRRSRCGRQRRINQALTRTPKPSRSEQWRYLSPTCRSDWLLPALCSHLPVAGRNQECRTGPWYNRQAVEEGDRVSHTARNTLGFLRQFLASKQYTREQWNSIFKASGLAVSEAARSAFKDRREDPLKQWTVVAHRTTVSVEIGMGVHRARNEMLLEPRTLVAPMDQR